MSQLIRNISVIVLTKNEEAGIAITLENLRGFEEVVVVDSASTDKTLEICNQAGVRIVEYKWDGAYPKKKQWSLQNAGVRNDWVLLLDADEYPTESLFEELSTLDATILRSDFGAFDLNLSYHFLGKELRHGHLVTKRSLTHRFRAAYPNVADLEAPGIREVEGHYQPQTSYQVGRLRRRLVHNDKDSIASWFDRHNRYSDWEAYLLVNPEARESIRNLRSTKGQLFDLVPMKPLVFFLYSYFFRFGFLDGREGFAYSFALAFYYWQIRIKALQLLK